MKTPANNANKRSIATKGRHHTAAHRTEPRMSLCLTTSSCKKSSAQMGGSRNLPPSMKYFSATCRTTFHFILHHRPLGVARPCRGVHSARNHLRPVFEVRSARILSLSKRQVVAGRQVYDERGADAPWLWKKCLEPSKSALKRSTSLLLLARPGPSAHAVITSAIKGTGDINA